VIISNEYLVASALPFTLGALGLRDGLPRATLEYLDGLAAKVRDRNARVLDQAMAVASVLNRIEVTPILLKGGANLLRNLYPDPAMRMVTDLDMLVPAERIDECVASLRGQGFQPLSDYRHPREHHFPMLGRPDLPVPVELHHQVLAHPYDEFLTAKEVRDGASPIDCRGVSIAVPAPTCAVIHNVAHAQLSNHDYIYGAIDLRALVDLALFSRAYQGDTDWCAVRHRFARRGARVALDFHLLGALDLLGAPIPPPEQRDPVARLLYWRARYLVGRPRLLDFSFRLIRPWLLLRREMSDATLRRRLAKHVMNGSWWRRHLRSLAGSQ
jgi:hypothetical protein